MREPYLTQMPDTRREFFDERTEHNFSLTLNEEN